jgi:hypothetical protein
MFYVTGTMTHRSTCAACGASVGLRPALMVQGRQWDAIATVIWGKAAHYALPALTDPTVRWECPCCDRAN